MKYFILFLLSFNAYSQIQNEDKKSEESIKVNKQAPSPTQEKRQFTKKRAKYAAIGYHNVSWLNPGNFKENI